MYFFLRDTCGEVNARSARDHRPKISFLETKHMSALKSKAWSARNRFAVGMAVPLSFPPSTRATSRSLVQYGQF
jgi:hypothetical protein